MATFFERQVRLEPSPDEWNLQESFQAGVHDPVWFLARQWQMGEHQGENASSPVWVDYDRVSSAMLPLNNDPTLDPTNVPAEALVESELDDWWTMGRRIRVGRRVAHDANLGATEKCARFHSPPPPYEAFEGAFDGMALWDLRDDLGIEAKVFGVDVPPPEAPLAWRSAYLDYEQSIPTVGKTLVVRRHHGGSMDWYSADAEGESQNGQPLVSKQMALPTPLEYPGAPHARFWEIEDAQTDIGGYAPDAAHFPTMLLVDLVYSHSDDWFLFPIMGAAGHILAVRNLIVHDSFGIQYEDSRHPGLLPPEDWSLFVCKGLKPEELVLWSGAEMPLESIPLESVQFGIDEQMNWLWAVERVLDARQVEEQRTPPADLVQNPPIKPNPPSGDLTRARSYQYIPGKGIQKHWHPYPIDEVNRERRFVQAGLADLSREKPAPLPRPRAEILFGGTPPEHELHMLYPSAIPSNGLQIERRWMLARDRRGRPVLWIQRQRKPLYAPPARNLRFDVLEESAME